MQYDKERYLCHTYLTLQTLLPHLAGQASRFLTLGRPCMSLKCAAVIASRQTLLNPQAQFSGHQPCHIWNRQGKCQDAYDLLAPVYAWFTEGFDTADLQDAKALLEALA